uniref:MOB kinase activator 3C n=2 Tax=Monodelphis domestica TaxID=13616 RepID=A0A5F8HGM8_MONDO
MQGGLRVNQLSPGDPKRAKSPPLLSRSAHSNKGNNTPMTRNPKDGLDGTESNGERQGELEKPPAEGGMPELLRPLCPAMALCLKQVFNKDKTFRPRKRFEPGTERFELYKKAQASLKSGLDLRAVVRLPPGESINDWLAVHVVDFFNRINLIYGTMGEFCTEASCPVMSGGPRYEYRWQDEQQYRRPAKLPAPRYMSLLMDWIEGLINNEDVFPTQVGVPFPKNFQQVCTKILTRLFRVFVHVYIHHFDGIIAMGAEAHVNTCYKHFYYFIQEFSLVDHRELEPLREMTEKICH